MDPNAMHQELDHLRRLIAERYGVSGPTLERQVRKLGRALPKFERKHALMLVEAERALGYPKRSLVVQPEAFRRAKTALEMHLETVDPADRRFGMILGIVTTSLVNIALAIGALTALYLWLS